MEPYLKELLIALVNVLIMIIGYVVKRGYDQLRTKMELDVKSKLALTAIQYVEETFKDIKGKAKFEQASSWLSTEVTNHGFKLTPQEAEGLIQSALRSMRDNYGSTWAPSQPQPSSDVVQPSSDVPQQPSPDNK